MKRGSVYTRPNAHKGQGLVEFALILPIFLTLIMGIVEFGRLMITYAGIASASREAARYGASVGTNSSGVEHYRDCDGIRDEARRLSVLSPLQNSEITIEYDNPSTGFHTTACPPVLLSLGDRIIVTVSVTFEPIVPLIHLPELPLTSTTARTVLRDIYVK